MSPDLLEHATRLLEREPTRCMAGAALYQTVRRETGVHLSLDSFYAALDRRSDRFTVVRTVPALVHEADWPLAELSVYQTALAATGDGGRLVILAERPVDSGTGGDTAADETVLADVHAALADVLRAADTDENLRRAAILAVQEMEDLRRGLGRS